MYSLKPIVTEFDVERPKDMYVLKEINPRTDKFLTNLENSLNVDGEGDLSDLEEKQELLLEKLKHLKRQLVALQEGLPICQKPGPSRAGAVAVDLPRDLVITVDPATIPYSLLLVLKQKRTPISFSVTFYTHSTVTELPEEAVNFAEEISGLSSGTGVRVSVIWKMGMPSSFEVIVSPTTSFWGEENFIRYLTRLGVLERSQETQDLLLDMSHQLLCTSEDKKAQTKLADRLMGALKKHQPSQIVDFTIYSALRNYRNATKNAKYESVLKEIEGRL